MLATFDNQSDLLAGMRRSAGWIKLTDEAAHRALLPALTHVTRHAGPSLSTSDLTVGPTYPSGQLKRLDELTLPEALNVIRALADERERLVNDIKTYIPPIRPRQHPEHGETGGGEHGET